MTSTVRPCRPYRIGDHSAALRGTLLRSMLVAVVIGAALSVALPLAIAMTVPGQTGTVAARAVGAVTLPAALVVGHWALVGRRRWRALELLIWAGRYAAGALAEATGIRNPLDRAGAATWLAAHPPTPTDTPETIYWRAYLRLLGGDVGGAREDVGRLPDRSDLALSRAVLGAQVDLAVGDPVELGALRAMVELMPPSLERAISAGEVGSLAAQVAWTCGGDDIGAVLAVRPLADDHPDGFLLRHYWLPFVVVAVASTVVLSFVPALLG